MSRAVADPIELEIFKSIFHSIAEEMGAALRRTAFSPNTKGARILTTFADITKERDLLATVVDADGGERHVRGTDDHEPSAFGLVVPQFAEQEHLNFPLLSDPDLAVHHQYGAYGEKTMYGKTVQGVIRSTFAVDPDGSLRLSGRAGPDAAAHSATTAPVIWPSSCVAPRTGRDIRRRQPRDASSSVHR